MKNNEFIWPVRVYYEDTDAGGVVYHSNYLNFMERGRTELLRQLGYDQDVLVNTLNIQFVVRALEVDYFKPARFNEMLTVCTSIKKLARASVVFQQLIRRSSPLDKLDDLAESVAPHSAHAGLETLIRATVKVACVDAVAFKPVAIPLSIKGALSGDY